MCSWQHGRYCFWLLSLIPWYLCSDSNRLHAAGFKKELGDVADDTMLPDAEAVGSM
jgi:hypothetical protein